MLPKPRGSYMRGAGCARANTGGKKIFCNPSVVPAQVASILLHDNYLQECAPAPRKFPRSQLRVVEIQIRPGTVYTLHKKN